MVTEHARQTMLIIFLSRDHGRFPRRRERMSLVAIVRQTYVYAEGAYACTDLQPSKDLSPTKFPGTRHGLLLNLAVKYCAGD